MSRTPLLRWTLAPLVAVWIGLVVGSISCGYQFANRINTLPDHIKRVAIGRIQNETSIQNAESIFYQAFQQEFATDRRLNLTTVEKADAVLYAVIKSFSLSALAYDDQGFASKYRATVTIDCVLFDTVKEEPYWKTERLGWADDYEASTLGAVAKDQEILVMKKLALDLTRSIHNSIMSKF